MTPPSHRTDRRRRVRDDRGSIAILTGIMFMALFVVAALVVDLGMFRDYRQQAVNAADTASLAGANVLYAQLDTSTNPPTTRFAEPYTRNYATALWAAEQYAATNYGTTAADWSGCNDPGAAGAGFAPYVGLLPPSTTATSCITFKTADGGGTERTFVRVLTPNRTVDSGFSGANGGNPHIANALSVSEVDRPLQLPCGLCVLGEMPHISLGNGNISVTNGGIGINGSVSSNQGNIITSTGNGTSVEGQVTGVYTGWTPQPTQGSAYFPDPFAGLTLPPTLMSTLAYQVLKTNPCTQGPGLYSDFSTSSGTCTLLPGLYVIDGGGWSFGGGAILDGTSGVTLYLTCGSGATPHACAAPGEVGASLKFSGKAVYNVKAQTTGPLAGFAIVVDRNDSTTQILTGNGTASSGTIYDVGGTVQMNGNGCATAYQSMMVVKDLAFNGTNPCVNLNYDPSQNAQPLPAMVHLSQ